MLSHHELTLSLQFLLLLEQLESAYCSIACWVMNIRSILLSRHDLSRTGNSWSNLLGSISLGNSRLSELLWSNCLRHCRLSNGLWSNSRLLKLLWSCRWLSELLWSNCRLSNWLWSIDRLSKLLWSWRWLSELLLHSLRNRSEWLCCSWYNTLLRSRHCRLSELLRNSLRIELLNRLRCNLS